MEIRCPYCEKTVQVPGGGQFTCPSCRAVFAVDLEPQAAAPPGPAAPQAAAGGPPPLPGAPPPAPAAPPLAPTLKDPGGTPANGPACAKHPTRTAAEVCKRCGNFMCALCTLPGPGGNFCPDCVALAGIGGAGSTIPWESERVTLGLFAAYWKTAKACLFDPDAFFRAMPTVGGLESALGFNVLGVTVFGWIGQVILIVIMSTGMLALGGSQAGSALAMQIPQQICQMVALPIVAAIGLFIGAAIYHLVALILGAQKGFECTFRILSYGMGSVAVFNLVPALGALVGWIWSFVLLYYGFKNAQQLSSGRALIAATWTLFLIFCCGGAIVAIVFGALVSSGGPGHF